MFTNFINRLFPLLALGFALVLATLPASAAPDLRIGLPALFDVTGVATNDRLNIRRAPSPQSERIGSYAPDRQGIEVIALSDDGRWGKVVANGENGWVSMRFLQLRKESFATFPSHLSCFGTEPFWSMTLTEDSARLTRMGQAPVNWRIPWWTGSANNAYGSFAISLLSDTDSRLAVLSRQQCSDGMVDADYGWTLFLVQRGQTLLTGCCTMQQR